MSIENCNYEYINGKDVYDVLSAYTDRECFDWFMEDWGIPEEEQDDFMSELKSYYEHDADWYALDFSSAYSLVDNKEEWNKIWEMEKSEIMSDTTPSFASYGTWDGDQHSCLDETVSEYGLETFTDKFVSYLKDKYDTDEFTIEDVDEELLDYASELEPDWSDLSDEAADYMCKLVSQDYEWYIELELKSWQEKEREQDIER